MRFRTGRIFLTLLAAVATLLAIVASASAGPVSNNGYDYYTTADLCTLTLTPKTADRLTGETHTVTATVTSSRIPSTLPTSVNPENVADACFNGNIASLAGATVQFSVTGGPHAGTNGVGTLDTSGQANFSYVGTLVGTDTIQASLELPDLCQRVFTDEGYGSDVAIPTACEWFNAFGSEYQTQFAPNCLVQTAGSIQIPTVDCPTVTLTDTANVTWSAPPAPPVVVQADPSIAIADFKRCVSHTFRVSPSYVNGTVKSSTLFIDAKQVASQNGTGPFTVKGKKYKAGKHNIEVVTVFSNGKSASKFGSFTRCKIRTAVRKVSPKFTG